MKNIFILLLVILFTTACASTKHVYDDRGNKLLSIHSGKITDGLDYAHGARILDIYERDEYGNTSDKIARTDIQPFVKEPFWAGLLKGIFVGTGSAAINAVTFGTRNRRGGGVNINNSPQMSTNANSDSESNPSTVFDPVTDVSTVFDSSHVTDVEAVFDSETFVDTNTQMYMDSNTETYLDSTQNMKNMNGW